MQKKRQIQLVVRDRMNSICPSNFFRTTDTTDTTDTTIWEPGLRHNKMELSSVRDLRNCFCIIHREVES